jgi:Skp family chaperone for outer membrane proteins
MADDAPRIAVVNMTEVFNAHPETKKVEAELGKKRSAARKAFDTKTSELKKVLQKHQETTQKLVAAGNAPGPELKTEARNLLDQASDLEREVAAMQTTQERDLKQEFIVERQRILGLIVSTITTFNANGSFTLILDRSAESANGIPQVLHAPGARDITHEILALIKKGS